MRVLLLLVACCLAAAGQSPAVSANDEKAVRELIGAYAQAREARDAKRLAAMLAPDADQLVSSGEWRRGREELVRGMLASSESNTGSRRLEVERVRFIAPGVAIADARYEIADRRMWSTFVVSRVDGVWRIEGIRNMLPAGGR